MSHDPITTVQRLVEVVLETCRRRQHSPVATYRLQFHAQFTFADAIELIPYLHELGVTHVYASPYLRALRRTPHGYDVCSHDELNPELGDATDFGRFVATLRQFGMGHILDFVPNHMAASAENPWWYDVLENGPNSPYSQFFDIDWHPVKSELANRVLLPFLGEQFGDALESGKLKLTHHGGSFTFDYFDNVFPVGPKTAIPILEHHLADLEQALGADAVYFAEYQSILTALKHLPPQTATKPELVSEQQREKEVIKRRLRELQDRCPAIGTFIDRNVAEFNGRVGEPSSFDQLDELVCSQAYRLCHWKAAADEINYRRFFDINELAAICMEHAEVFLRAHRFVLNLLVQGLVDGLRIDHVDGLYDPTEYLCRLQWAYLEQLGAAKYGTFHAAGAESGQPVWEEIRADYLRGICDKLGLPPPPNTDPAPTDEVQSAQASNAAAIDMAARIDRLRTARKRNLPLYVVIEKILGADEPLPAEWPVAGTTGYDFLSQLNGLFLEPRGLAAIEQIYSRFLGTTLNFADEVHRCKLLILRVAMSSELQMLAHRLNHISEQHRRSRDFTLNSLRHALLEILACFPVYRTYSMLAGVSDRDRRFINLAVALAKRRNPAIDSALFEFVRSVLLFEHPEGLSQSARHEREIFVGRFQQVTSPVMAKGVEDTAFYVVCPLLSVNEVGSHPAHAVVRVDQFHHENTLRLRSFPDSMLGTSTHDTKRSEDVRARLNVLTEIPHLWRKAVNQWARLNRRYRVDVDGVPAPSRNDEYVFYQSLVGVWPVTEPTADQHEQLVQRLQQYMEKATREAKVQTSWVNPNHQYDAAVRDFVAKTMERRKDNRFLREFRKFAAPVVEWGLWNSVAQVTLKLLSPGVPDIYLGQELWNLSLVDPDNRRAVDFVTSRRLLEELKRDLAQDGNTTVCKRLRDNPRDPKLKQFVTWQALQLRREYSKLFREAVYQPLSVDGSLSDHVCAFAWHKPSKGRVESETTGSPVIIVAVPRFIAKFDLERADRDMNRYPLSEAGWRGTSVKLDGIACEQLRHVFSGQMLGADQGALPAAELFRDFPVAVLASVPRESA